MPIMPGSTPLALPGGLSSVTQQQPTSAPLSPGTFKKTNKKPRKAPKIKKAFGSSYGAFKK